MAADDQTSLGDSNSDSDEPSVPAPATETRPNSTATTLCAADPPVAGSLVPTPLSEERLWELLNSSSQYTLGNICQVMDGRLAEMLRFNATLHWGPNFSADRDAPHKEIKLVKSHEASLNVQISEMNAVIKSHQEMYDRLRNRFHLALRGNEILTKEVNYGRSEYLVGIQAFKKSHGNLHKILCQTDPKDTTLTSKLQERNRDEDMGPEALVLMVEGFELDKMDWETLAPDSQTRCALKAVYNIGLEDARDHDTLADAIARAKVRFAEMRAEKQRKAEEAAAAAGFQCYHALKTGSEHSAAGGGNSYVAASPTVPPAHSPPASKLEQAFLPSLVPSDAEVKCMTVGIEKFRKFMAPDHPWRKAMDLWPDHACLFDTTDFQLDSHILQRAGFPERLCGHWVSPEAVKRFLSRMAARLLTIKDADERRKFKLALERLKKTLLDPTLPFYTIEKLMWVPADEDEEMEEGEVAEDDADSTATLDLNQDSGDTPVAPQDAAAEAALVLLFADYSPS
ncbi:hypothetical protein PHMEG_00026306 [Phytophthora megakarya]|uniref:Uncharacterized protein n=1 Tax=Phytophthora megakarya TaxID=4795 RepID=A0A225V8T9_9STRA|nr:hypothetical protein PHMEG_00026306 [Phytophthora megakarya]